MKTNHIIQQSKRAVKRFSLFTLLFSFAIASCNREELAPQGESDLTATFKVEAPALTRATEVTGLTRYIVEAYEGKDLSSTPLRAEAETGALTLGLKKNTEYTFLFWADKGTAKTETVAGTGYWDVTTLQTVKIAAGKENTGGEAAYCFFKELNSKELTPNYAITLKNATAQVNFIETEGLATAENKLVVTYAKGTTLNVATGKVTDVASEMIHTFTGIAQTAKDGTLVADYVLAPLGEKNVMNLKMQFNTETEKALTNVPFEQNFKTNIKGKYSNMYASEFIVNNEVDDYTNNPDVEFPKVNVGDFYMKDGTWLPKTTVLTEAQKANCIGIVFYVNANGKSGKMVGLDEPEANWNGGTNLASSLTWGPISTTTAATNELNGLVNMATIKTLDDDYSDYPAFAWVHSKNPADTDYSTATKDVWYLPATKELRQLYAAMSGLKWVASGANAANGEIDDWGNNATMPNDTYAAARTAFNALFTAAGKTPMGLSGYYWLSTEYSDDFAWYVNFGNGGAYFNNKSFNYTVRAVLAF